MVQHGDKQKRLQFSIDKSDDFDWKSIKGLTLKPKPYDNL